MASTVRAPGAAEQAAGEEHRISSTRFMNGGNYSEMESSAGFNSSSAQCVGVVISLDAVARITFWLTLGTVSRYGLPRCIADGDQDSNVTFLDYPLSVLSPLVG